MTPDPLNPRAQALLDAACDGLGPDDAAIARMRARVLSGAGGAAVATKAGMSLAAKLTIVSALALVVGGGTWWIMRETDTRSDSVTGSVSVSGSGSGSVSGSGSGSGSGSVAVAVADPAADPAADPVAVAVAVAASPSRRAHPLTPTTLRSSLAAEVALVDDAMAALRRDDAAAALAAADDHVARFGKRGQLAEEAAAIRVEALCRLGDTRWSASLDGFDTRWPRSAQRPRLTTACKDAP